MRPRLSMLDASACERLHEATLQVLEHTGVKIGSAAARRLLADAGARVEAETDVVHIPRAIVAKALETAPSSVLLAARDARHDALLDHTRSFATNDGMAAMVLDHRSGERRLSTAADLHEAMVVSDALDEIGVAWYTVTPCDESPEAQPLRGIATMLAGTGKHVQAEVSDPRHVSMVMEMLATATDEGRWERERPIFSAVYCPISPLQHEGEALDAAMGLAEHGVPITVYSLALAGGTAPVTLAGTVVQVNAEVLSGFVVLQLAAPGTPLIYVANSGIMDMRAAIYGSTGPEGTLINLAMTELGRWYDLPVLSCGFGGDANEIGMQCGFDGGSMGLASMLAGADLVTGLGALDAAQMLYLPKLVLDAEVMRHCRRLVAGVEIDDAHLAVDLIDEVGPGGHYLGARATRTFLREGEHWLPEVFARQTYESWLAEDRSEVARATTAVDEILATHRPKPLPEGAPERFESIIAEAVNAALVT